MLKAGALYFAITISFFIAVVSACLIMLAAHYRNSYLKELRFNRLINNQDSGIEILLADVVSKPGTKIIDLFGESTDSVQLETKQWGIFDLGVVRAFIMQDTLKRAFLIGSACDSDQAVLYLSDEDRPLSLSGATRITGEAVLPKSGVKQSYVEGKPYTGEKLIYGPTRDSGRTLEELDNDQLEAIRSKLVDLPAALASWKGGDLIHSYFDSTRVYRLPKDGTIKGHLSGNIILYSDTTVVISSSCRLNGVQIYAPFIRVEDGFKGECQLFARDSITVGAQANFAYPSAIGIIRTTLSPAQPKISLGEHVQFKGVIFSYEDKRSAMQSQISFAKAVEVEGLIYCKGIVKMEKGLKVKGKISSNRFLMQTATTLYENFLVDVDFNRKARSKYYLNAGLFGKETGSQKVLQWLN